jgi:hypothetical protein
MLDLDLDLPVHPLTCLTAVGIVNGRPVWPILGAAPDGDDDKDGKGDDDADADGGDDKDDDKPLGPAGQKAYEAEKTKRREASAAKRAAEKEAADLRAEVARLKSGTGDDEAAVARQKAVDDAIASANTKANNRILRSEVQRLATGKLANPALALQLLDLSKFEVDDDGDVDADEIGDAIADLVKKEPYLAAQGRRFQGGADGGPRNRDTSDKKPPQVTEEQLAKMSPEQIVAAQKEGKLADLLGG